MTFGRHVIATGSLPAGVLCDMDGTLTDSEHFWFRAQRYEYGQFGIDWTTEDQNLVIGRDIVDGTNAVFDRFHIEADAVQVASLIVNRVISLVKEEGVTWRPGAYALLERLRDWSVPCALVTSSYREYAQLVVDEAPEGAFSAIVTGDQIVHGKPAPDPFLTGAAKLGVSPQQCVAFEDSEAGVQSALAAGAITVVVPFQSRLEEHPEAHILSSLELADREFFEQLLLRS